MVIPFAPSTAWVREYLRLTASGTDNTEAARLASASTGISGKQYARCAISTGTLTVPVAGGAGTLKRRGADPVLSEHGKWRREHLGAWSAAYGRCAYHTHLMPEIETVYTASEGMTLGEFNGRFCRPHLNGSTPRLSGKEITRCLNAYATREAGMSRRNSQFLTPFSV